MVATKSKAGPSRKLESKAEGKPTSARAKPMLALLRGINVGGHKQVPMAKLRELAKDAGLLDVQTYIQSGNVLFRSELPAIQVEQLLEAAIQSHFGFSVVVVCRSLKQWQHYAARNPFRDAEEQRPNLLHLGLPKRTPAAGAEQALAKYALAGERVKVDGDVVWLDFPQGVARSKITPAVLDRAVGSVLTARNWKTVQKLVVLMTEL
jgi:uncharacterized protein (DUF1697 family)